MTRRRSALLAPLLAALLVATTTTAAAAPPTSGDVAADAALRRETGVSSAEAQMRWLLAVLDGRRITDHDLTTRFDPGFLEAVPREEIRRLLGDVAATAPYEVSSLEADGERSVVARVIDTLGVVWQVELTVAESGQIIGFFIGPGGVVRQPGSFDDVADRLDRIGTVRMVAAEIEGTECSPIAGTGAWKPAPIASVFKLYVLGAVADAIAAGELTWDDELVITAAVKSLPSGVLQDRPDGSTVSVREAAELMISISDNTAADLLLRTVGRPAVEAAQATYGHRSPQLNEPFLTTRELFLLKASGPKVRLRWIHGGERVRRAILARLADADLTSATEGLFADGPVAPDRIEFFASPLDVCRALATLVERAATPGLEPVLDILTLNPGVPAEDGMWSTIAFKGGSEPGLAVGAWLVEDAEGNRSALVGSVVNPRRSVGELSPLYLLAAGRDLLSADPPVAAGARAQLGSVTRNEASAGASSRRPSSSASSLARARCGLSCGST